MRLARRQAYVVKWLIPLLVLAAVFAIFINSVTTGVIGDTPLLIAVFLTAVACAYDIATFKIPYWTWASMFGVAALYSIMLYVQSPTALEPFYPLIGTIVAGLAGAFIIGLAGALEADVYLVMGIGSLVPLNYMGSPYAGMLFIVSVVLNTAIIGTFVAFGLGYLRRHIRRGSMPSKVESILQYYADITRPKKTTLKKGLLQALGVAGFWVIVRVAFVLLDIELSTAMGSFLYMFVLIMSFMLITRLALPVVLLNSVFLLVFVPTFVPFEFGTNYLQYVVALFLIVNLILVVKVVTNTIDLAVRTATKSPPHDFYPYVPAILTGLFVSLLWGDLFLDHIYPAVLSLLGG